MAYFSNASDGEIYSAKYCNNCIHGDDCAILDIHFMYNGEQCSNKTLENAMLMLIPEDKDGNIMKCKMFIKLA